MPPERLSGIRAKWE